MKRIETTNRVPDLFGVGKPGFKNGNLVQGIKPTEFSAEWTNGVQEEILAVVEGEGLVPAAGNQLLTALDKRFSRTVDTLAALDTTSLPDGASVVSRGRNLVGDGGGNVYKYDAASNVAANGWSVVAPTFGPGRLFNFAVLRSEINIARDFGLRPGQDITAALNEVLSQKRAWYLPGSDPLDGDWLFSDDLPLKSFDQIGRGDGMFATRLRSTVANKHGFCRGALAANRLRLKEMWVKTLGTGSPLYFPFAAAEAGIMYGSEFNGLRVTAQNANGMHLGLEFQTAVRGCWGESDTMHSFFLQGGNTTKIDGCYAIRCGPNKAGYRSLGGGEFTSANGIDSGGSCFWFGGTGVDAADPQTAQAIFWRGSEKLQR
jgi:hypothetical protein